MRPNRLNKCKIIWYHYFYLDLEANLYNAYGKILYFNTMAGILWQTILASTKKVRFMYNDDSIMESVMLLFDFKDHRSGKRIKNERMGRCMCGPGVGVTKPIFSVPLFSIFSVIVKKTLAIEYHVYIWQVLPQLSCGDTCQIWMWFRESNRYFCNIENFAYGEISERSFSNPHPS